MASLADALAYQAKRSQYVDDMTEQPSDLEKAVQDQFGMQPNMDRGALLPYKSKDKGWVAPEIAYQLAKLLASPSVAMHGGNISPQEAIESGNALSGFMTPAGLLSKPSPAMARMNVYHGSPHTFDAFDASKIGTGEGAQAYGHGLYFAESPDVAKSYQTTLTADRGFSFGGKSGLTRQELQDAVNAREGAKYLDGVTLPSGVADHVLDAKIYGGNGGLPRQYKPGSERANLYQKLQAEIAHTDAGSLYKVDLPDEQIAKMLDWDKPLSEQSAYVQKAIENIKNDPNVYFHEYKGAEPFTGQMLYRTLGKIEQQAPEVGGRTIIKNNRVTISELLRQRGIPGIKYLDEQSRAKGAGTSNFVVFPGEEHNLKILKRE